MSTLAEIEAAAALLPLEEQKQLLRSLAERLLTDKPGYSHNAQLTFSSRGFPISKGRRSFASGDVARIELQADLS